MKIEVGMYVRTKYGIIDRIIDIRYNDNYKTELIIILLEKHKGYIKQKSHNTREENGKLIIDDDTITYWFAAVEILKSSYNPIDLIGVGDYVNGECVTDFDLTYFNGTERLENPKRIGVIVGNDEKFKFSYRIKREDIKSIVTKEQFEKMSYRVN